MKAAALTLVRPEPEPDPDTSYEAKHRNHVLSRDWARVHTEADRRKPFGSVFGGRV